MAGTVTWLDPVREVVTPEPFGSTHPMREVNRKVVAGGWWSPDRAAQVAAIFDGLSVAWHGSHSTDLRLASLEDALDRGDVGSGRLVELGCGTAAGTERLAARHRIAAAVELSAGMLSQVDRSLAPLLRADASALPFPAATIDICVLVNMFLFAVELDRVLAPDGRIVWVNTMGDETPIHLTPEVVLAALPGTWSGLASYAGTGLWCVARRA